MVKKIKPILFKIYENYYNEFNSDDEFYQRSCLSSDIDFESYESSDSYGLDTDSSDDLKISVELKKIFDYFDKFINLSNI